MAILVEIQVKTEFLASERDCGSLVVIRAEMKKPFQILSEMASLWRPHGDSNPGRIRERDVSWASRRWGQEKCTQVRIFL